MIARNAVKVTNLDILRWLRIEWEHHVTFVTHIEHVYCEHHKLLIHHFVMSITLLMEWKSYISYLMSHYVKIQWEKRISNLKEMKAESLKSVTLVLRLGMCQYKIGSGQIEKKVLPRQTGNCKGNSRSCRQWFQWVSHSYLSISSVWRFISLVLICQHIYQNVINSSILKPFTTIRHSGLVFRPFRF